MGNWLDQRECSLLGLNSQTAFYLDKCKAGFPNQWYYIFTITDASLHIRIVFRLYLYIQLKYVPGVGILNRNLSDRLSLEDETRHLLKYKRFNRNFNRSIRKRINILFKNRNTIYRQILDRWEHINFKKIYIKKNFNLRPLLIC